MSDIVVELRLRTKETQKIFEEVIEAHPHFCLEHKTSRQSNKPELIILEAGYDHYPVLSFIESITQHEDAPDIFLTSEVQDEALARSSHDIGVAEFSPSLYRSRKFPKRLTDVQLVEGEFPKREESKCGQ